MRFVGIDDLELIGRAVHQHHAQAADIVVAAPVPTPDELLLPVVSKAGSGADGKRLISML
jgi:hypothetical protein